MTSNTWPAPAKLNLMLHITGRREDGYHELQTIFQFIDFFDELEFTMINDNQLFLHCENFAVPENEDIIIRAAKLLRENFRRKNSCAGKKVGCRYTSVKKNSYGCGFGWWEVPMRQPPWWH